ncbi:MAG TPA: phosphoglycerate kinase [archaeon]|nr:phosphoglycerate kinase [archaeon]
MGDIKGRALVRIDVNVPVRNGKIVANNLRFKAISKKINSYSENGIAPVIVSHQGRKGDDDYLESLEQHKEVFQKLLPQIEFFYSNNLDGTELKSKMLSLKQGQALVVKNIRDHEDEKKTFKNADERKNSEMVKFFSPLVDLYINDAPATMHRGDTSLTAFRHALPSFLGLQMEEELKVLQEIKNHMNSGKKIAIIFGGKKWEKLEYVYKIAANKNVTVLCGGVPGQSVCYLRNKTKFNKENEDFISNTESLDTAAKLIQDFDHRIIYPIDFVLDDKENVHVEDLKNKKGSIMDIGEQTLSKFFEVLEDSEVIIYAGPVGKYEKGYDKTIRLVSRFMGLKTMNYTFGGNSADSMDEVGLDVAYEKLGGKRITSGGSGLAFLANDKLPALEVFESG